ncbi:26S proteasome non-ATPase regulatory subunit 12-like [Mya arenaria]|uniref:26S proteasome non-ATPase regulatory subunit 12-like n=1 Tax=Mya arenaria TaxID=6604 RepID=UPI0022E117CC|nr:26S proteasome non-ATPase regulatory subunit 12-like [Mya arenaria]
MADTGNEDRVQKMEVDYSSTVDEKVPKCEKLAKQGKLSDALEILLAMEKQTRTGADTHSLSRVLETIVRLCFETKNWDALNDNIVLLTKKRGQIKQSVTKMIQEACTYVEKTPNLDIKLKLIDTLRTVTAGKIYVEIERARLTRTLAKIREDAGKISEAADILQELQVETFGSMEKKEKVEFILEQMRLCLAKKDFIRTQIISKKINTKFFEDAASTELKLKFYQLMIELDEHEGSYLSICRHYRAVFDTQEIKDSSEKAKEALRYVILYLVLSPFDNEQSDMIHRAEEEKMIQEMPKYKDLLKCFITNEIIQWKLFCQQFEAELKFGSPGNPATHVFNTKQEGGAKRWADLKNRVVEHNIRVMAKYYTRIRMKRMGELLDLADAEVEEFLSTLVVNKTVQAKIDRLEGIVNFTEQKDPNDILNDWSHNINTLMQLVNKTTHLITKEEMVHKLA